MPQKISISEFTVKIRLDSGEAFRGIKRLQTQLAKFQAQAKKAYSAERAKLSSIRAQSSAIKGATRQQTKFNNGLSAAKGNSAAIVKSFGTIKAWAAAGLGFWAVKNLLSGIYSTVNRIIGLGTKVQQSMLTVNAAVSASDVAQGLSPTELNKLKKNQRLFAEDLAITYGLSLQGTLSNYAKFFAASSSYIGELGSQKLFKGLAQLGVVYGLSTEKMDRAMVAFTQMASKNQVMAEELKQQLGDVLPGSMEIFARAMTKMGKYGIVSVKKLYKLMEDGKVVASDVLPAVGDELERMAASELPRALQLLGVSMNRFGTATEIFSTGALNQFDETLGAIIDQLGTILTGKGFQAKVGIWIDDFLLRVLAVVNNVTNAFERFEELYAKEITVKGKLEVLDNFWSTLFDGVGTKVKDSINDALRAIEPNILKPFAAKVGELIADAISHAMMNLIRKPSEFFIGKDKSLLDIFGDWDFGIGDFGKRDEYVNPKVLNDTWSNSSILNPNNNPQGVIIHGDVKVEAHGSDNPAQDAKEMSSSVFDSLNIPTGYSTSSVA